MTYGLRIKNAAGKVTLDTSYRMGRVIGQISVSGSGALYDAGFSQGDTFATVEQTNDNRYAYFTASVSGNTLTWTYNGTGAKSAIITYGVY